MEAKLNVQATEPSLADGMYLSQELVDNLQTRLARIEGHVRGVKKMLAAERDCDDVLTQVAGIRAAVTQVAILLLEGNLDFCVSEALRSGEGAAPVGRFKKSLSRALK
ncbi:MAG: metal-sensitive transcriptional regulator [Chloroflexi bacterium]|nr:metal-sensitive transcriptional regulator [Chloroflexota bacterium]